jgi:hypothetical protein
MAITENTLPDAEDFARMETELFGKLERSHTRQVRRHRLVAAAAVVLIAGAGVASVTQARPTAVSNAAYCYAAASTGSHFIDVEAPYSKVTTPKSLRTSAAVAVRHCASTWHAGLVVPSKPAPATIPKLQACVRNDQVIAVFPKKSSESADEFCTNLGMYAP